MIVFRCDCGYTWVIDFIKGEVIGPITNGDKALDNTGQEPVWIGNKQKAISMEVFADNYGDCWGRIVRKIEP